MNDKENMIMKKKYFLMPLVILCLFIFTGCNNSNKTKLVENKDYFIRGEFTGQYLDITQRGYYIDTLNQPNAPYLYIICMGEKNTGGYSLIVKEVNKVNENTEIIVEEIAPAKDATVTLAFTSPTIIVEFPKYQENVVIKNTKGEEFTELKDY